MNDLPASGDPIEDGFRRLGIAGGAGVLAGLVVGGFGGRIVMRVSAIAADSDGLLTEGGNRVGDITIGGTIALIIFGGGLFGFIGGLVLFVVHPWLPGNLAARATIFAVTLPAMVASTTIAAENRDFLILDPPELNITLFLAIFVAFGGTVVVAYERMLGLMPPQSPAGADAASPAILGIALVLPALLVSALLLADEKPAESLLLLIVGIATTFQLVHPIPMFSRSTVDRWLRWVGPSAVAATTIAGSISLADEIEKIV